MNEQISKTMAPLKQFWGNASKGLKKMIVIGAIAIIAVALVFSVLLNFKEYAVIYDQLTSKEASEILVQIQQMNVDVKLDGTGTVMVPKKDESRVRMALAIAGFPRSGLSYYMMEQGSGMLTTDYERQQYVNAQLQERIAASIRTLDGVRDAIVTITVPDENVFYLQEKESPTASVIIHMENGDILGEKQVVGIQNLVVKSVSGLTKENVAISDSGGNDLIGDLLGDGEAYSNISITKKIETAIQKKILSVLEGPYGRNKLRISVTATVDTDDLFKEEILYNPSPDGENRGVINQETRSEESSSSSETDGGIAGTSSNSEIPTYPTGGALGESTYSSSNESTSYSVSQVISQFQKDGAKIESVSIGIAIDKAVFEPEEREKVTRLVAYAVGVEPESIAVESFQFYSPVEDIRVPTKEEANKGRLMLYIIIGGAILLLIIAVITVMLIKRKRKKTEEMAAELQSSDEQLDELFGDDSLPQITPVKDARMEQVKEFALTNPEIAAQMIRSWIKSDAE